LVRAGQVTYTYDAEDRLASFTTAAGRTSRLTVNPEPELSQVLVKTDSNGVVTRYVWGVGLLYEEVNGELRVNHYDHRGSTIAFTGPTGQVVGRIAYGPFGEIGERTGETDSIFLFGGLFGVLTSPNGLNYMRFRWYSPEIKRFLSPDSEFGDVDDPSSFNPYTYAANNPVTLTDPNGQFWNILVGAIAGAAITAASDLIFTGKLGPPERYVVAAVAGAAIGACFGVCGAVATLAVGAGSGFLGGVGVAGASALIQGREADAGDVLQGGLEGAVIGAELGFGAGGVGKAAGTAGRAASAASRGARFSRASSVLTRVPGRASLAARQAARVLRPAGRAVKRLPGRALRPRPAAGRFSGAFRRQAGRAGTFEAEAAAARRLASRNGLRVRFRETRVGANQRGLSNLNNGRQATSGQYRHRSQYTADRSRAGRAPENKPNNEMATF
jgi:RHS repeat-associated protein